MKKHILILVLVLIAFLIALLFGVPEYVRYQEKQEAHHKIHIQTIEDA